MYSLANKFYGRPKIDDLKVEEEDETCKDLEFDLSRGLDAHFSSEGAKVLQILSLPPKSRVETRMKLLMKLGPDSHVTRFKIDDALLASPVLRTRVTSERRVQQKMHREDTHKLPVLMCQVFDSTSTRTIQRCHSCIQRERKILVRKAKDKNIGLGVLSFENNSNNIVQFYCEPIGEFSSGEVTLPMRLTCYCRHHQEPNGFIIKLALVDIERKVVLASGTSGLVMITDDRKSQRKRARFEAAQNAAKEASLLPVVQKKEFDDSGKPELRSLQSNYETNKKPTVFWIIPADGPMTGGIPITILGANFTPDTQCFFGDTQAQAQLWGDSTMIVTLPPSNLSGNVEVTLRTPKGSREPCLNQKHISFSYIDDSSKHGLELALQVICLKLTGSCQEMSPKSAAGGFLAAGYRVSSNGVIPLMTGVPDLSVGVSQRAPPYNPEQQRPAKKQKKSSLSDSEEENSWSDEYLPSSFPRDRDNGDGGYGGMYESKGSGNSGSGDSWFTGGHSGSRGGRGSSGGFGDSNRFLSNSVFQVDTSPPMDSDEVTEDRDIDIIPEFDEDCLSDCPRDPVPFFMPFDIKQILQDSLQN